MENKSKRILASIAYFSLMALAFVVTDLFVWSISTVATIPLWIKIIYYVWSAGLMIFIVLDLIATVVGNYKFTTGIAYYILTVLAVIMAVVVYFVIIPGTTDATVTTFNYIGVMTLNAFAIILAITGYFFGIKRYKYAKKLTK